MSYYYPIISNPAWFLNFVNMDFSKDRVVIADLRNIKFVRLKIATLDGA